MTVNRARWLLPRFRETFKYKAWEIAHSNLCFRRHLGRRILQLDTRTLERLVIFLLDVAQKSGACPVGEYAVLNVIKRGYLPQRFDKFRVILSGLGV